jgi:hypothetical protein
MHEKFTEDAAKRSVKAVILQQLKDDQLEEHDEGKTVSAAVHELTGTSRVDATLTFTFDEDGKFVQLLCMEHRTGL